MTVQLKWRAILVTASTGDGSGTPVPAPLTALATALQAASPGLFFSPSRTPSDDYEMRSKESVYLQFIDAVHEKIAAVGDAAYRFDPDAGEGFRGGHEVAPVPPYDWQPVGGGSYAVIYPVEEVASGTIYYMGFKA